MGMYIFLFAILVLFAFSIVAKLNVLTEPWPFYAKKIMTNPERVLYQRLVRALPECMVFTQVQLSQAIGVKKGHDFHKWHNRINRMSLDFVLCLPDSSIVAVIELDDKTHELELRIKADKKKDKAIAAAVLTMIRWSVKEIPSVEEIRQRIAIDPVLEI